MTCLVDANWTMLGKYISHIRYMILYDPKYMIVASHIIELWVLLKRRVTNDFYIIVDIICQLCCRALNIHICTIIITQTLLGLGLNEPV